ncbi:MAG: glycoside hydrolase family 32 protein [Paracoccus sp. (in: a-proteobacteria)]|uniref:glycoside hydrolase family 32 protein n=1 Tax=Paracoccus sp. TaxID=267 RepID=UPI0026E061C3|nr:glycoside hydrolase family 32 protein [Paracoccus sp. (in: a-proteobacteria)]MDO5620282.1 glycoside hydrolase family 32 protein [Paracoccus sp. (in: a-proteobacteria)]
MTHDPWRQAFHISAPQGLVNDPNGLIHWNGQTHVFYQWNPSGCTHSNKHWGHVASADLAHWQRLSAAIGPTDWFDKNGCYSGSAVDADGLTLIYTGNVKDQDGNRQTYQCLARSADGVAFTKNGPVISGPLPGYTAHFRDPKLWYQDGAWRMVLGVQTETEQGTVILLHSPDLTHWELSGQLLTPGNHGYMCECPDLFALDGSDVLLFSEQRPGSNLAGYVTGRVDLASAGYDHGPFQRLDHGRDFYAPQTFAHPDGRRIMLGWMGLPEQETAPSVAHGWFHCLTVPRELHLRDGRLLQQPVAELAALRGPETQLAGDALSIPDARAFDLLVQADAPLVLTIRDHATLRVGNGAITLYEGETLLADAALTPDQGCRLRVLADHSSVEIFAGDGEIAISARIYPPAATQGITVTSPVPLALTYWPMSRGID